MSFSKKVFNRENQHPVEKKIINSLKDANLDLAELENLKVQKWKLLCQIGKRFEECKQYHYKSLIEKAAQSSAPLSKTDNAGVFAVQFALNQFGGMNIGIDGIFGDETLGALKKFQKSEEIPVTGEIDQATLAKIQSKFENWNLWLQNDTNSLPKVDMKEDGTVWKSWKMVGAIVSWGKNLPEIPVVENVSRQEFVRLENNTLVDQDGGNKGTLGWSKDVDIQARGSVSFVPMKNSKDDGIEVLSNEELEAIIWKMENKKESKAWIKKA